MTSVLVYADITVYSDTATGNVFGNLWPGEMRLESACRAGVLRERSGPLLPTYVDTQGLGGGRNVCGYSVTK